MFYQRVESRHGCRCACQISERCDHFKSQSRSFETSRDLTGRYVLPLTESWPHRYKNMDHADVAGTPDISTAKYYADCVGYNALLSSKTTNILKCYTKH